MWYDVYKLIQMGGEDMKAIEIWNLKTAEFYDLEFQDMKEAYHWIVNHLDLSLEWKLKIN